MLELRKLIIKIDILETVITNPVTQFGQIKPVSDSVLCPSYDLWQKIHDDISQYYQIAQCPEKKPLSNQTTVWQLKPIACFAAYLAGRSHSAENDNLACYFEQYDPQGILVTEFYKHQCEEMAISTNPAAFYTKCKSDIYKLFNNLGKARFLDLMIMLNVIALPNNPITVGHIKVGFKLFKDQLENNQTKTEFEAFFARGAVLFFSSLTAFTQRIESYLNNPTANQSSKQAHKPLTI